MTLGRAFSVAVRGLGGVAKWAEMAGKKVDAVFRDAAFHKPICHPIERASGQTWSFIHNRDRPRSFEQTLREPGSDGQAPIKGMAMGTYGLGRGRT